ncbi:MAG: tripartite tricarboxylate transporter permease [Nitratireductor sp.]
METLVSAFWLVARLDVVTVIALSALYGMTMGAIPGLSATMAAALLVPVTFFMDPLPAVGAIVTATSMAIFAGDIPAALMRIPGTPASAAYIDDAYSLTRRGRGAEALGVGLGFSAVGGLLGALTLTIAAPSLAEFGLKFSSYEYFWLALLGLSCTAVLSTGSPLKGAMSLLIGLWLSTVGIGAIGGAPRFTFGAIDLYGGIPLLPALVGMFALPELIRFALSSDGAAHAVTDKVTGVANAMVQKLIRNPIGLLRGSAVGITVGILPGAGTAVGSWFAYAIAKRFSKRPQDFGKGSLDGLSEASAANSAAIGGTWVPALVFGIPGDSVTAIAIGVLMMKGLTPGPLIFMNSADLMYAVFFIFFAANLVMIPLGLLVIRGAIRITQIDRAVVMPIVLVFCIVGAFVSNNTAFDVAIMLALGVLAFFMEENDIPIAPAILGLILGQMVEENFVISMAKAQGNPIELFSRPISLVLGVAVILIWLGPIVRLALRSFASAPRRDEV